MGMIGFVICKRKLVILPPNTSAPSRCVLIAVLCGAGKPGTVWLEQIVPLEIANVFQMEEHVGVYVSVHTDTCLFLKRCWVEA